MAEPELPPGWEMWVYSDEVTWWDDSRGFPVDHWVCQYPFVPGFFVSVIAEGEERGIASSYPIAGPFKTVLDAIATINLIQT